MRLTASDGSRRNLRVHRLSNADDYRTVTSLVEHDHAFEGIVGEDSCWDYGGPEHEYSEHKDVPSPPT